ncbi:MAG: hypothetical protein MK132_08495 [Lentisphaerales bacterium]|nr:hypothetical protein [Lentisphaerales bacterium]
MNRFLKCFLIFLAALLLISTIFAGLFWHNWQKNEPASVKNTELSTAKPAIGTPFTVKAFIQTPWYRKVEAPITFSGSNDIQVSGEAKISFSSADLKGSYWELKVDLLAFKNGKYKDLELTSGLSTDKNGKQSNLKVFIPEVNVSKLKVDKKAPIALQNKLTKSVFNTPIIEEDETSNNWIWIIPTALAIILSIFLFNRKSAAKVKVVSAWDEAQSALKALQADQQLNDEKFFVRLSDILRLYIEKRFNLPATEKTSEEFILQVKNDDILKEKHKRSLENFLSTADMVKFARMSANPEQKQDCLLMAGSFVKETIPLVSGGAS